MALEWQLVDVKFTQGLDTRTEEKLVIPGKWRILNNLSLADEESLKRRDGISTLVPSFTANGLAVRDNELLTISGSDVGSVPLAYPTNATSVSGQIGYVNLSKQEIQRGTGALDSPDCANGSGFTAYCWRDRTAANTAVGVSCTVVDETTGTQLISATSLRTSATATSPRVIYSQGAFFFFYLDGTSLYCRVVAVSAPQTLGVEVALVTSASLSTKNMDAIAFADSTVSSALIVYAWTDGIISVKGAHVVRTGTVPSLLTAAFNFVTEVQQPTADITALGCANFGSTLAAVFVMGSTAGSGVWINSINDNFTAPGIALQIDNTVTVVAGAPSHITATLNGPSSASGLRLFYDQEAAFRTNAFSELRTVVVNTALAVTSGPSVLTHSSTYGVGAADPTGPQGPFIAGKAFTSAAGKVLLPAAVLEKSIRTGATVTLATQSTFFLLDGISGVVLAKALYGTLGAGSPLVTSLPTATPPSTPVILNPTVGSQVSLTMSLTDTGGVAPQFLSVDTNSVAWQAAEVMTGGTSGAVATAVAPNGSLGNTRLYFVSVAGGPFVSGETITGSLGFSGVATSTQVTVLLTASDSLLVVGVSLIGSVSGALATASSVTFYNGNLPISLVILTSITGTFTNSEPVFELLSGAANTFLLPVLEKGTLSFASGINISPQGLSRLALTPNDTIAPIQAQLGESLYFAGGSIASYDGAEVTEHGFPLFPEGINFVRTNGGGGLTFGVHQICAVYEWVDNAGQRHQSAPSLPVAISADAGNDDFATVKIPTLLLSQKAGIGIVVYMTLANGLIFLRVNTVAEPVPNVTNASSVTFIATIADAALAGNEPLYTQPLQSGTPLANIAPGPSTVLTVAQNRLWFDKADQPNAFGYSQQYINNVGLELNDTLGGLVDQSGGGIAGFSALDEKMIILCKRKLYVVFGTGPDAAGGFSNYSDPQEIPSDVGCVDAHSILKMPKGVIFKSQKGWQLLGRDLTVNYIGSGVEAYNGNPVSSAVLLVDRQECRWASASGTQLVYSYLQDEGQWSTFTVTGIEEAYKITDAVWWPADGLIGRYVHCSLTRGINQDVPGQTFDEIGGLPAVGFSITARTSFLKLQNLNGFQRVRQLYLTASADAQPSSSLSIAFDFDDAYGSLAPGSYTLTQPLGMIAFTTGMPIDLRSLLRHQKCKSVAFTFTEGGSTPNMVPLTGLQGLTLQLGMKRGTNKLPAAQSAG